MTDQQRQARILPLDARGERLSLPALKGVIVLASGATEPIVRWAHRQSHATRCGARSHVVSAELHVPNEAVFLLWTYIYIGLWELRVSQPTNTHTKQIIERYSRDFHR